uniref:Uncharacterized protein n=1 Tax=Tanacetum cinerariifolium TaxID=118510 RepID=A0A699HJ42_TANCI|nr:hypothetical protein [Tanacetum cinerariifolium]
MDESDLTMEEYIELHAEKVQRRGQTFNWETATYDMTGLPPRSKRHLWLRLTEKMRKALTDRLMMVNTGAEGSRRTMTWRQFILALGLHTTKEMAGDGFEAYWVGSLREITDNGDLSNYWARISSVEPEKVTATNLFYLRSMDEGTAAKVSYLLAQYLFRHAEGRKYGARLSGGHFIGRLAEHFGLITKEGIRGMTVVVVELRMIDMDELVRLRICERLGDTWAW